MAQPKSSRPLKSPWLRRGLIALAVLAIGATAVVVWRGGDTQDAAAWRTGKVEKGDIRVAISATGTLAAISTVDVSSQISGQVTDVLVDYNDRVTKGQVIARIDPSTYEAQIAQGDAAANSARAGLATAQAVLRNAEVDYQRKASLGRQQLVSRGDVDQARATLDQARAQVSQAQAQIRQQVASTQTARLNVQRSVIRSPVDGVVLTRSIERARPSPPACRRRCCSRLPRTCPRWRLSWPSTRPTSDR